MTSKQDIRGWLQSLYAPDSKYTHMLVVTDQFDWTDFPVYVSKDTEDEVEHMIKDANERTMSAVMEVYSREFDMEEQLAEQRAWHPPSEEKEKAQVAERYPEHEKMRKLVDDTQGIGAFVDWLCSEYVIAERTNYSHGVSLEPVDKGRYAADLPNYLLGRYYDIDLKKIADEKDQMLEDIRVDNARREVEDDLKELNG